MANQSQKLWFKKTLVITVEHYGLLQCGTKTMTKTMKNIIVISYDTHKAEAWYKPKKDKIEVPLASGPQQVD